jgi:hypothetical protein
MKTQKRVEALRLSRVCHLLASVLSLGLLDVCADVTSQINVAAPLPNNYGFFITYAAPMRASSVSSATDINIGNDYWSVTIEQFDFNNDNAFDDIKVTAMHLGEYDRINDKFDKTKPGPPLSLTFKDVPPNNPGKEATQGKTDTGKHGADDDYLNVQFFHFKGQASSEIKVNLSHTAAAAPVPEPGSTVGVCAILLGLWGIGRRRLERSVRSQASL